MKNTLKTSLRSSRAALAALLAVAALSLLNAPVLVSPLQAKEKPAKTVEAPIVVGQPVNVTVDGKEEQLADGTHVKLQLVEELVSGKAEVGKEVRYVVDEDVMDSNKKILIRKGAPATGVITRSKARGGLGKSGKLEFTCESVTAVDNSKVPLRGSEARSGKSSKGSMAAVTLLLSPLGLFMKGHNITIKQGTVITAYVNGAAAAEAEPVAAKK